MVASSKTESPTVAAPIATKGRQKKDSISEHLICSLTHSLPWDPVTAMDGSVYERLAIEEYFATNNAADGKVKSPAKGHWMGQDLLPAPHIKSIIQTSIENGTIAGELADTWKEKAKQANANEDLLKEADKGSIKAMELVAVNYMDGENGFKEDPGQAYGWAKRAHDAGSVFGMALEGNLLVAGAGVEKDMMKGMIFLGMAEGRGSDLAAYLLGLSFSVKCEGVPLDKVKARQLLEKCLKGTCTHKHMDTWQKQDAQERLEELVKEGVFPEVPKEIG